MVRIGVFARLSEVSIKTLRHYDEFGLLKPTYIDDWSGYRYYTLDQLPRLYRILALKDLGFTLGEITTLLHRNLPTAEMTRLLQGKHAEMQQRVAADQARLARVETRLRQLTLEGTMSDYDVRLKKVEAQLAASIRATIPDWDQVTPTFNRLFDELIAYVDGQKGQWAGAPFDRWLDDQPVKTDLHVEVCAPLLKAIPAGGGVQVVDLEGVETMATTIHHGPFTELKQAHEAVMRWAERNDYRLSGPSREIYLQYERNGNPADYVTEIQYPVTRS
jgi:DNA-binding transcriptional MerR regulator